jgi:hypothetical protein
MLGLDKTKKICQGFATTVVVHGGDPPWASGNSSIDHDSEMDVTTLTADDPDWQVRIG